MTMRWRDGKKPTKRELMDVISNALPHFRIERKDIERIADAVLKFYQDRVEGRR